MGGMRQASTSFWRHQTWTLQPVPRDERSTDMVVEIEGGYSSTSFQAFCKWCSVESEPTKKCKRTFLFKARYSSALEFAGSLVALQQRAIVSAMCRCAQLLPEKRATF